MDEESKGVSYERYSKNETYLIAGMNVRLTDLERDMQSLIRKECQSLLKETNIVINNAYTSLLNKILFSTENLSNAFNDKIKHLLRFPNYPLDNNDKETFRESQENLSSSPRDKSMDQVCTHIRTKNVTNDSSTSMCGNSKFEDQSFHHDNGEHEEIEVNNAPFIFCTCRQLDDGTFMIGCSACDEWYHPKCINLSDESARGLLTANWRCPKCIDIVNIDNDAEKYKECVDKISGENNKSHILSNDKSSSCYFLENVCSHSPDERKSDGELIAKKNSEHETKRSSNHSDLQSSVELVDTIFAPANLMETNLQKNQGKGSSTRNQIDSHMNDAVKTKRRRKRHRKSKNKNKISIPQGTEYNSIQNSSHIAMKDMAHGGENTICNSNTDKSSLTLNLASECNNRTKNIHKHYQFSDDDTTSTITTATTTENDKFKAKADAEKRNRKPLENCRSLTSSSDSTKLENNQPDESEYSASKKRKFAASSCQISCEAALIRRTNELVVPVTNGSDLGKEFEDKGTKLKSLTDLERKSGSVPNEITYRYAPTSDCFQKLLSCAGKLPVRASREKVVYNPITQRDDVYYNQSVVARALTQDFEKYPALTLPPDEGEIVAFRLLEMSEDYSPQVSGYKTGTVVKVIQSNKTLKIKLHTPYQGIRKTKNGKFELSEGYMYTPKEIESDSEKILKWGELLNPKKVSN